MQALIGCYWHGPCRIARNEYTMRSRLQPIAAIVAAIVAVMSRSDRCAYSLRIRNRPTAVVVFVPYTHATCSIQKSILLAVRFENNATFTTTVVRRWLLIDRWYIHALLECANETWVVDAYFATRGRRSSRPDSTAPFPECSLSTSTKFVRLCLLWAPLVITCVTSGR